MGNLEVYTTGGGYFVQDILQFLALYTGSGDFDVLMTIALTAGVICLATSIILGLPIKQILRTFAIMTIVGGLFIGRTTDVDVHDKTYGTLSYYGTVSNVPYGVALLAHYTTGVSYHVTQKLEQLISTPNDLSYQSNGMIFGASIVAQQARWRAVNGVIHERLVDFYQNCIVRGINLRYFDIDVIVNATDLAAATGANIPNSLSYYDVGTGSVETCQAGWTALTTDVGTELKEVLKQQAASTYQRNPGVDGAGTVTKLENTLTAMQTKIGMSSATATNTVRQAMLINAFDDSVRRYAAISGNDASLSNLTNSIADIQRRSAYSNVGVAATKWVPYLKIVFEVIYYGAFPFAVMMMLTPMAWQVFKGYAGGFLWLASWEPISAILHGIVLEAASGFYREAAIQTSDGLPTDVAMTWSNHFGVIATEQEIGATAGYLMMSVPFLSLSILIGARQMNSLATSMLNVGQGTATEAGRAAATGNVQLSTASMSTMNANQWQTSSRMDTGRSSGFFDSGGGLTMNRNGTNNFSGGSALPQGVGLGLSMDKGIRQEVSRRASASRTAARTQMSETADYINQGASQFSSLTNNASLSETAGTSNSTSLSASQSSAVSNAQKTVDRAAQSAGVSSDVMLKAGIGAGLKLPFSAFASGDLGINAGRGESAQKTWEAANSKDVQDAISTLESVGSSTNWGDSSSSGTAAGDGNRWSLDEGKRMTQSLSNTMRQANDLTDTESRLNTTGVVSSQQLTVMAQDALSDKFPNNPAKVESILNARDFGALSAQKGVLNDIVDDLVSFQGGGGVSDRTKGFNAGELYQPSNVDAVPQNAPALRGQATAQRDGLATAHRQRDSEIRGSENARRIPADAESDRIRNQVNEGTDDSVFEEVGQRAAGMRANSQRKFGEYYDNAQEWWEKDEAPALTPSGTSGTHQSSSLPANQRDVVIRTVLGEAGAESEEGMAAVASVIQNRAQDSRWPSNPGAVALQPWQFSSWNQEQNGSVPNNHFSRNSAAYARAGQIVDSVFSGQTPDRTGGAVNFYAPQLMSQHAQEGKVAGPIPNWYNDAAAERGTPDAVIGGHIFTGRKKG